MTNLEKSIIDPPPIATIAENLLLLIECAKLEIFFGLNLSMPTE